MRKIFLSAALAVGLLAAPSAFAGSAVVKCDDRGCYGPGEPDATGGGFAFLVGAGAGAAVGVGITQGWFAGTAVGPVASSLSGTTTIGGVALPLGAMTGGFVAGVGTMVLLKSISTPCHGFRIAFDTCRKGKLVR